MSRALRASLGVFFAGVLLSSSPPAIAQDHQLILQGYDVVAYFTDAHATIGDPKYQYEFDAGVYRFASTEHLEMFKADPDKYAPQFGNLCTAALSRGEKVIADPNNWYINNQRLHVFGKSIGPGLMKADPDTMEQRARAQYAKMKQ